MAIQGNAVLIVIDVMKGELGAAGDDPAPGNGIPIMTGAHERHERIRAIVAAAREAGVPPVFIQEVHKRTLLDFGRELDGAEPVHCLEGDPGTELADGLEPLRDEYLIRKRRYSAFFGTELEIVLKAYKAETVILVGALTDVCVHYTFADAHQHDYVCRVVTDAVGGSSPEAHAASLRAMEYLQRDALITSDELLATLRSPEPAAVA
ncbi:MAG: cysteine hydrolase [Solirubrobacteraceae bacterium]|nr:cysteine hydrolase [Solirubrobacteraceae bacterium]